MDDIASLAPFMASSNVFPPSGKGPVTAAQAEQVGKDFESMFIGQMMQPMFDESVGSELFGGKDTAEIYKSLMVDSYSKVITQAGGIGIAGIVKSELLKLQEVQK